MISIDTILLVFFGTTKEYFSGLCVEFFWTFSAKQTTWGLTPDADCAIEA